MAKIVLLSDLHLEESFFTPPAEVLDADVVVLAGDISVGLDGIEWAYTLDKPVVYVPGNHEYRGLDVQQLDMAWKDIESKYSNVHILQRDQVILAGVRFLGCTLWSDFEFHGYQHREQATTFSNKSMPEYKNSYWTNRLLRASDTIALHQMHRDWLKTMLATPFSGDTVVVTHHAPHRKSLNPKYANELLTAAFISDLDALMGRPFLWCHGHTHFNCDYYVDETRVVSRPRGYFKRKDEVHFTFRCDLLDTHV